MVKASDLKENLKVWLPESLLMFKDGDFNVSDCAQLVTSFGIQYNLAECKLSQQVLENKLKVILKANGAENVSRANKLSRAEFAIIMDTLVNPFQLRAVNHLGHFTN